jgi:hypothetical protein
MNGTRKKRAIPSKNKSAAAKLPKTQAAFQAALESGTTGMGFSMRNPLTQAQPDRTDHPL